MSFVVLALGAILSLGGAASIYYGAGIVQVEQGWTGVIAGATALAAGIVTIALGLVLRALGAILATLKSGAPASLAAPVAGEAAPAVVAAPAPVPVAKLEEAVAEPPVSLPVAASLAGAASASAAWSVAYATPKKSVLQETEESLAVHDNAAAPLERALDETISAQGHDDDARAIEPAFIEPKPADVIPPPRKSPDESRSIEDIWRRVDRALEVDEARPPRAAARVVVPPAPAVVDEPPAHEIAPALHDEAFAPFEPALDEHRPPAPAERPVDEPLAATTFYEPAPEHELPPTPAAPRIAVADEPAAASREPSIIGRYEADGVAYVMFADGSIDATSDEGSYHFKSMADLRAFIEGKE